MLCRCFLLTVCLWSCAAGLQAQGHPVAVLLPTTQPAASQAPAGPGTAALGTPAIYVSGKVVVADGSDLPPNVVLNKLCGSKHEALGFADNKGNFSVKLSGSSLASLVDASDDNRGAPGRMSTGMRDQGGVNLLGCELLASAPGYRSESLSIGSRRSLDNPNIGTILLHRLSGGAGTVVSQTMLTAPKNALKAYNHAMSELRKGKPDSAQKSFAAAVEIDAQLAGAWYELGHLQLTSDPRAAKVDLEKAVAADSKFSLPYTDLTILAYRRQDWDETLRLSELGLHLDSSGSPELYFFNAATQFHLEHFEEAEKKARDAIKVDYSHSLPKSAQLLGYILAARHDYSGAAEQLRVYLASAPPDAAAAQSELKRIEAAAAYGKHL